MSRRLAMAPGEDLIRVTRPHGVIMFGPTVIAGLLLMMGAWLAWVTPDSSGWNMVQWSGVALLGLLAVPLVVMPFVRWRTTSYVLTNRRVIVTRGLITRQRRDLTLSQVADVAFSQSIGERMLRAGTLVVEAAGDSADEVLPRIPDALDVHRELMSAVAQVYSPASQELTEIADAPKESKGFKKIIDSRVNRDR